MKEIYETIKSIMSEVMAGQARPHTGAQITQITIRLNRNGKLEIQADWSDNFHTRLQLTEEQAKAPDAEFFIKTRLKKERRDNEGATP